jgi:hypothetical protein
LPAFVKAWLNFLACGARTRLAFDFAAWLRRLALGLTTTLAFRLHLFDSKSIVACLLFVRLRRSHFQREYNTRFTCFGMHR